MPSIIGALVLAPILLGSCGARGPRSDADVAIASDTCLSEVEKERLERPPVSIKAARALATHWGICRNDVRRQESWLALAAKHGDAGARDELALMRKLELHAPPIHAERLDGVTPSLTR
jgi:hypothetical protein